MPFTADQFGVNATNTSAQNIASMNLALADLSKSPTGSTILQDMVNNHTVVTINNSGNDSFTGLTNVINWDPTSALQVVSASGVIGVQSAAIGLIHEGAHSTDPSYYLETTAQREAYATAQETIVANDTGDATRGSYAGGTGTITEFNSTEHTTVVGGQNTWQEYETNGTTTTDGVWVPQSGTKSAPVIGGAIQANNEDITVAAGATVAISGSGDTIVGGASDTITITGNSDTFTGGFVSTTAHGRTGFSDGDIVSISGGNDTVSGTAATFNLSGNSDYVSVSGFYSTVNALGSNDFVTVQGQGVSCNIGSYDTVADQASSSRNAGVGGIGIHGTGTGDVIDASGLRLGINLNGATINTTGYSDADVVGGSDTVNGGGGTNESLNLQGSNDTATNLGATSDVGVTGNYDNVTVSSGTSLTVTGNNDASTGTSSTTTAPDIIALGNNGTGDTVNLSSGLVTLGQNDHATVTGGSDSISTAAATSTGVVASVNGSNNTLSTTAPSDTFTITGTNDPINTKGGDSVTYIGTNTGDTVYEPSGGGDTGSGWVDPTGNPSCTGGSYVEEYKGTDAYGEPIYGEVYVADPIVLSLQGGKVQTTSANGSNAYFDTLNNGTPIQTGWITSGEGVLVYDPKNSITIPDESNLVAGYAALDALAGSNSGVLTASNPLWSQLRIWVGTNPQQGQLMTLDQLGITSINLNSVTEEVNSNGNTILNNSSFTFKNGTTGDIAGVALVSNPTVTEPENSAVGVSNVATTTAPLQSAVLRHIAENNKNAANSVDQLIQAMAAFSPHSAGQTGVLAANDFHMQPRLLAVSR